MSITEADILRQIGSTDAPNILQDETLNTAAAVPAPTPAKNVTPEQMGDAWTKARGQMESERTLQGYTPEQAQQMTTEEVGALPTDVSTGAPAEAPSEELGWWGKAIGTLALPFRLTEEGLQEIISYPVDEEGNPRDESDWNYRLAKWLGDVEGKRPGLSDVGAMDWTVPAPAGYGPTAYRNFALPRYETDEQDARGFWKNVVHGAYHGETLGTDAGALVKGSVATGLADERIMRNPETAEDVWEYGGLSGEFLLGILSGELKEPLWAPPLVYTAGKVARRGAARLVTPGMTRAAQGVAREAREAAEEADGIRSAFNDLVETGEELTEDGFKIPTAEDKVTADALAQAQQEYHAASTRAEELFNEARSAHKKTSRVRAVVGGQVGIESQRMAALHELLGETPKGGYLNDGSLLQRTRALEDVLTAQANAGRDIMRAGLAPEREAAALRGASAAERVAHAAPDDLLLVTDDLAVSARHVGKVRLRFAEKARELGRGLTPDEMRAVVKEWDPTGANHVRMAYAGRGFLHATTPLQRRVPASIWGEAWRRVSKRIIPRVDKTPPQPVETWYTYHKLRDRLSTLKQEYTEGVFARAAELGGKEHRLDVLAKDFLVGVQESNGLNKFLDIFIGRANLVRKESRRVLRARFKATLQGRTDADALAEALAAVMVSARSMVPESTKLGLGRKRFLSSKFVDDIFAGVIATNLEIYADKALAEIVTTDLLGHRALVAPLSLFPDAEKTVEVAQAIVGHKVTTRDVNRPFFHVGKNGKLALKAARKYLATAAKPLIQREAKAVEAAVQAAQDQFQATVKVGEKVAARRTKEVEQTLHRVQQAHDRLPREQLKFARKLLRSAQTRLTGPKAQAAREFVESYSNKVDDLQARWDDIKGAVAQAEGPVKKAAQRVNRATVAAAKHLNPQTEAAQVLHTAAQEELAAAKASLEAAEKVLQSAKAARDTAKPVVYNKLKSLKQNLASAQKVIQQGEDFLRSPEVQKARKLVLKYGRKEVEARRRVRVAQRQARDLESAKKALQEWRGRKGAALKVSAKDALKASSAQVVRSTLEVLQNFEREITEQLTDVEAATGASFSSFDVVNFLDEAERVLPTFTAVKANDNMQRLIADARAADLTEQLKALQASPSTYEAAKRFFAELSGWGRQAAHTTLLGGKYLPNVRFHAVNFGNAPLIIQTTLGTPMAAKATAAVAAIIKRGRGANRAVGEFVDVNGRMWTLAELDDLWKTSGAGRSRMGFEFSPDVMEIARREFMATKAGKLIQGRMPKLLAKLKWGLDPAKPGVWTEVAEMSDNLWRRAVFEAAIQSGSTPFQAGQLAREALLDYTKVTDVERKIVGNIVYFWSFRRLMMTETLRAFLTNPSALRTSVNLSREYERRAFEEGVILPEWAKTRVWTHVGGEVYDAVYKSGYLGMSNPAMESMADILNVLSTPWDRTRTPQEKVRDAVFNPVLDTILQLQPGWSKKNQRVLPVSEAASLEQFGLMSSAVRMLDLVPIYDTASMKPGAPRFQGTPKGYRFRNNAAWNRYQMMKLAMVYSGLKRNYEDWSAIGLGFGVGRELEVPGKYADDPLQAVGWALALWGKTRLETADAAKLRETRAQLRKLQAMSSSDEVQ